MNEAMTARDEALFMADMSFQLGDASGVVWAFHMIDAAEFILSENTE